METDIHKDFLTKTPIPQEVIARIVMWHKTNSNQNYTKISSHPSENGCHQEHKEQQMLVRMR
jgi:hypothetical protein